MLEKIQAMLADALNLPIEKVTPDAKIVDDLGADSLDLVELLSQLEDEYGIIIPDEEVAKESEDLCSKYDLSLYQFKNRQLKDDAKYILVDHNIRDVPGEIVAVIDHHPVLDGEKKELGDRSGIEKEII